ncbi:MAG: NMD3-related protein [Candidatus Micrarchaeota archaeon]|nr:NMD3-related protein [Candidatus Micrarchaeota archaeon]
MENGGKKKHGAGETRHAKACARCGSAEGPFAGALCAACFAAVNRLYSIPGLEVRKCQLCGKVRLGSEWKGVGRVAGWVKQKIKPNYPLKSAAVSIAGAGEGAKTAAELDLVFDVHGTAVGKKDAVEIKFVPTVCLKCSRIASGYHEAIIQLRGDTDRIERVEKKIIRLIERMSFVSGLHQKKEGVDIHSGSNAAAKEALSALGFPLSVTYKLITERQGKRVYRASYVVRL